MEHVVLLDEAGHALGTAEKSAVHHRSTPLHLAFSCYVLNPGGQVLLTRRALTKPTWPGAWTNSCCGHPLPCEPIVEAVQRRLLVELGMVATSIDLLLPRFRYRATMPSGVVENEMCPVFRATVDTRPDPNPDEVNSYQWITWDALVSSIDQGHLAVSPWCLEQTHQLRRLGPLPSQWPTASCLDLPVAARLHTPPPKTPQRPTPEIR
ncbi:isopentenyl-diphosphate Delta-isomerase [Fodinicola feengrottensis]|uniref:isopentenyl-diphosphate Delta-isomerase n=1 Tax=Fodinicola feengrottensis TaxID=435914 RepID=UPI0013D83FD6|nr:isopentenyl-diphosphate Delta-isomerase [Fodinicola feengrottensis]